jgi:hypothetical protein
LISNETADAEHDYKKAGKVSLKRDGKEYQKDRRFGCHPQFMGNPFDLHWTTRAPTWRPQRCIEAFAPYYRPSPVLWRKRHKNFERRGHS